MDSKGSPVSSSSNMVRRVLGTSLSLLLLASIIQGMKISELLLNETLEAEVGQNVTMSCFMKDATAHKILDFKWTKNGKTKLGIYDIRFKEHLFWPNVTIEAEIDDAEHLIGSRLHLPRVNKDDSGVYSCEISAFPLSSFHIETTLKVQDEVKLLCNVNGVLEVPIGDNATIQCKASSFAHYKWTKDNELVSENESLVLWRVTEAHAGVYKLTVNTGFKSLHENVTILVLTATTSLRIGPAKSTLGPTVSPETSTAISSTITLPTELHWTAQPNSSTVIVPATGHVTPPTALTSVSVPSSPDTQSITDHLLNTSTSRSDVTELTSMRRTISDETKNESGIHRLSTEGIFPMSTQKYKTADSLLESPRHTEAIPNSSLVGLAVDDKEPGRSHMLLVFIIVPLVILIVIVVTLYRRQLIKKRMDLPPPFKPPPPPVKYTAARRSETQVFPTSRCNSIVEPMTLYLTDEH